MQTDAKDLAVLLRIEYDFWHYYKRKSRKYSAGKISIGEYQNAIKMMNASRKSIIKWKSEISILDSDEFDYPEEYYYDTPDLVEADLIVKPDQTEIKQQPIDFVDYTQTNINDFMDGDNINWLILNQNVMEVQI